MDEGDGFCAYPIREVVRAVRRWITLNEVCYSCSSRGSPFFCLVVCGASKDRWVSVVGGGSDGVCVCV